MRLKAFVSAAALICASLVASAQIAVDYGAYPTFRDVIDAASVPIPDGNEARLGYFDTSFDLSANGGNLNALQSAWHQFDSTTFQLGVPGRFAAEGFGNNAAFDNQKIYFWIFKTSGNTTPTVSFDNVLEYGVFATTQTFLPHNTPIPGNTQLVTSGDVNQAYWGSVVGPVDVGHLQLAPVPEPQQYALALGLGLVCFAAWRRYTRATA